MTEIYSNDTLKILKDSTNPCYKMEFNCRNDILVRSLLKTHIIKGGTSTSDYKSIKFNAVSIKFLSEYTRPLSIAEIAILISDLGRQLKYLIEVEKYSILGYRLSDVMVINDTRFAFVGSDYVYKLYDGVQIMVTCPFDLTELYGSPELLKVDSLGEYIDYQTAYFSLGCLAVYALLCDNTFYTEYLRTRCLDKIINSLDSHSIKGTKLYWLLSRCLTEDSNSRCIVFV